MKNSNGMSVGILADVKVFDYLKEKVGERKTRTEAYCDLLDKALAGFVSPFLRKQDYELRPCQCHVTVSDLAAEWHWHRATVRSFLETMEAFGLLERTRLAKSVVITMSLQTGQSAGSRDEQQTPGLASRLRAALYDWITGKADSDEAGTACGEIVRQVMDEAGIHGSRPCLDSRARTDGTADDDDRAVKIRTTALECIALAAMQKVLRKLRFEDGSELMRYFRLDLYGDWTGLIETSKGLAGLILAPEENDDTGDTDDDREFLKTLLNPFLAFAAKAQEAEYRGGDCKLNG